MTMRSTCAYRQQVELAELHADHGFLGIRWGQHDAKVTVDAVLPGTPADAVGLKVGDQLIAVDGQRVDTGRELQALIYNAPVGSHPTILFRRGGQLETIRPTLISWPNISY
jgi:S1-C subfamily serine protease